jgi:8-oxo-(d)GTP phosphatase
VKDQRVRAAGGVIERTRDGTREILLVHRPRYDDLHRQVAVSEYRDSAGRTKRVRYFAMTPHDETSARPQNEVDAVAWLGFDEAIARLTYSRDRELISSLVSSSSST